MIKPRPVVAAAVHVVHPVAAHAAVVADAVAKINQLHINLWLK